MSTGPSASASGQSLHGDPARRVRIPEASGRLGKLLASVLVAGLVLFHGRMLWQRVASFSLFEPWVALRWAAAALLLGAFVSLQRTGISVLWGHKALILWLLVLLCHAGAVAPPDGHQALAEPGLLLAVSLWGFALRAILGELKRLVASAPPSLAPFSSAACPPGLPCAPGSLTRLSPRPPPADG